MSRYCGEDKENIEPIFNAAKHWKTRVLHSDKGIFENEENIWRIENLEALQSLIEGMDRNKDVLLDKLKSLLSESEKPEVSQLAAEIYWFMLLCPTDRSGSVKRELVKDIWKISQKPFPEDSEWLKDEILGGIGRGGIGFFSRLWWEWNFFISLMIDFKKLSLLERDEKLSDCWKFAEWLEQNIPKGKSRQLRHMILFLLFPENFERIFSGADRISIVCAFTGKEKKEVEKLPAWEIDRRLRDIRKEEEEKRGTDKLDFYNPPLEEKWRNGNLQNNDNQHFAWAGFYESMADKLLDFKEKRDELVKEINRILDRTGFSDSYQDIYKNGISGPLKDICPFTIIGTLNRGIKNSNRQIIAGHLAEFLNIDEPVPESFGGIPVLDNRNSWFFDYEKDRRGDDIDGLWEIFEKAIEFSKSGDKDNRSAFVSAYDKVAPRKGVGWKLTIGLYWIRPWNFPTLDSKSQAYLNKELGIKIDDYVSNKYPNGEEYLNILKTLKDKFQENSSSVKSFPELSLASWEHTTSEEDERVWEEHFNEMRSHLKAAKSSFVLVKKKINKSLAHKLIEFCHEHEIMLVAPLNPKEDKDLTPPTVVFEVGDITDNGDHLDRYPKEFPIEFEDSFSEIEKSDTPKNLILYGPPGTGKTYRLKKLAKRLYSGREQVPHNPELEELVENWETGPEQERVAERFEFVTFHQAYSYEDFVEGIRPVQEEETEDVKYEIVPGVFKRICQKAKADPESSYAIFIDEINRGNIASIFGELITLIEPDKRVTYGNDGMAESGMTLTLPYSGEQFGVPTNLYIYGAMNTADRSIALLDTALRRRFEFEELMPNMEVINGSQGNGIIEDEEGGTIDLRKLLETINLRIQFLLNRDMTIGHSYFIDVSSFTDLKKVLLSRIIPLLQEYFYEDWHKIQLVFRDVGPNGENLEPQIIRHEPLKEEEVLGFDHDDFEDSVKYRVADEDQITPQAVRKVYEDGKEISKSDDEENS